MPRHSQTNSLLLSMPTARLAVKMSSPRWIQAALASTHQFRSRDWVLQGQLIHSPNQLIQRAGYENGVAEAAAEWAGIALCPAIITIPYSSYYRRCTVAVGPISKSVPAPRVYDGYDARRDTGLSRWRTLDRMIRYDAGIDGVRIYATSMMMHPRHRPISISF